jgi:hypothetical protein
MEMKFSLIVARFWLLLLALAASRLTHPSGDQLATLPSSSHSQEDQPRLSLRMSRTFGYASGTGDIQGSFALKANGPPDVVRVVFLIDDQPLGEDTAAPFSLSFSTGSYPLGPHRLAAIGFTASGLELRSNEIRANFVSAEEGLKVAGRIALPLLAIVGGALLLSSIIPLIASRGQPARLAPGSPRHYGPLGGTICPKCHRPFALHLYGLNLLTNKLDRCPHCGRWSLVRRKPLAELQAAEAAELEQAQQGAAPSMSEAERLRKVLDDSRYENL